MKITFLEFLKITNLAFKVYIFLIAWSYLIRRLYYTGYPLLSKIVAYSGIVVIITEITIIIIMAYKKERD